MIRTVYHFDDLGRKVPVGSYDDGSKAVGGRIFYIDSNSDETVEFYDAQGNVLSNVGVGDTPTYYKVTSAGVSGKDKYYVYYDYLCTDSFWTYLENSNFVFEFTGSTSQDIGAGKTNTAGVMALHNGAYITTLYSSATPTIWYTIKNCRDTLLGGCGDWYCGSKGELDILRLFINANKDTLGLTDLFMDQDIWSSSEYYSSANNNAFRWDHYGSRWLIHGKEFKHRVIPMRSF